MHAISALYGGMYGINFFGVVKYQFIEDFSMFEKAGFVRLNIFHVQQREDFVKHTPLETGQRKLNKNDFVFVLLCAVRFLDFSENSIAFCNV